MLNQPSRKIIRDSALSKINTQPALSHYYDSFLDIDTFVSMCKQEIHFRERPLIMSDDFWWFLTYLPTMSDNFYLIMSNFRESFWTYLS